MLKAAVCRLTEKNMANQKFRQSETAILIAYLGSRGYPTAKLLAKKARIARSTLYLHHQQPQNIPRDYEEYLFRCYKKKIARLLRGKNISLRTLFFHTLVFISQHRRAFQMLFRHRQSGIVKKMLDCLRNPILTDWRIVSPETLYLIYENEIIGVIEGWSRQGFALRSLEATLSLLLHLTNTAPRRLAFLAQNP